MAAPRVRFIVVLLFVLAAAAFCGARVFSQDRAKPREGRRGQTQSERRRSNPPPEARRPQRSREADRSEARPQERTRRDDAQRRQPRPRPEARPDRNDDNRRRDADRNRGGYRPQARPRTDAQRRHPVPDGQYRGQWDRYHWRNWSHRNRYDRDRFPRLYFGLRLFDGYRHRGYPFGPHYRLWYYERYWRMCYWPYPYAPLYGCGYYWVPTERRLVYDPYTGEDSWDYSDYQYVYLCID